MDTINILLHKVTEELRIMQVDGYSSSFFPCALSVGGLTLGGKTVKIIRSCGVMLNSGIKKADGKSR